MGSTSGYQIPEGAGWLKTRLANLRSQIKEVRSLAQAAGALASKNATLLLELTDEAAALATVDNHMQEWGAKGGPTSFTAVSKSPFAKGVDSGGSIDATSDASAIIIGETGYYHCSARQRSNGSTVPNGYITLALNGVRATLENRADGMFFHDHAPANNAYSTSEYIGLLNAGELITMGAPDSTTSGYLQYGTAPILGGIIVRRIK